MPRIDLPIIRTSERTTFKRCPQRWWWSYRDGLTGKGLPNKNLWFGTGIHLALSEWYGTGTTRLVHPLETWEKFCKDEMHKMRVMFDRGVGDEAVYVDAAELGRIVLGAYLEEYGKDEQWDFIACERSGTLRVIGKSGSPVARYAYTYDGVYRDLGDGTIKLLENKTAAAISTDHLTLDDQAGSYWATATAELRHTGILGPKSRISGITYNFLRKAIPDERPKDPTTGERCNKPTKPHYVETMSSSRLQRKHGMDAAALGKLKVDELVALSEALGVTVRGEISQNQPKPIFVRHFVIRTAKERNAQIRRIGDEAAHMDMFRNGTLSLTKTPRSTGVDACQWGCDFFMMCEMHEAGADWEEYRDAMYTIRDPYADHRKSAHADS